MYGKLFASLFTGSMRGHGDLQLTFAYMIANSTEDGICDFTPQCIADATGKPLALILECLRALEAPDEMSRTRTDNGRRIRLLDPERSWGWQIVNHQMYRAIASREAMKEAERLRKRDYRAFLKKECPGQVPDTPGTTACASASASASASEKGVQGETDLSTLAGCVQAVLHARDGRPDAARYHPQADGVDRELARVPNGKRGAMVREYCDSVASMAEPPGDPIAKLRAYVRRAMDPEGSQRKDSPWELERRIDAAKAELEKMPETGSRTPEQRARAAELVGRVKAWRRELTGG